MRALQRKAHSCVVGLLVCLLKRLQALAGTSTSAEARESKRLQERGRHGRTS